MSNSFIMTESIVRPAKMPYGRLKDNGFVGIEGEHAARALVVETKDDLSAFASINLIIDDLDCGAMTKTTSGGTTTLSMTLTSSMIGRSGRKICQLIMVNSGNTVVQKSSQFEAYVGRANEIERSVDDGVTIIILSEAVTEMAREAAAAAAEEAVADVVEDCQEIANAAAGSARDAAQSAQEAEEAAASIVVDATLDPTSTRAIQNKAVAFEIAGLKADLDAQVKSTNDTLNKFNAVQLISEHADVQSKTESGLTWSCLNGVFTITGATTSSWYENIYNSQNSLPEWFVEGKRIFIKLNKSGSNIRYIYFRIIAYKQDNTSETIIDIYKDTVYTVPNIDNVVSIVARVFVATRNTVNGTIHPVITNAPSNLELYDSVEGTNAFVSDLQNRFEKTDAKDTTDLIPRLSNGDTTKNGVTFSYLNGTTTINGTATSATYFKLCGNINNLPDGITAGLRYFIDIAHSGGKTARIRVECKTNGATSYIYDDDGSTSLLIPSGTTGLVIYIYVYSAGVVENERMTVSLRRALTNYALSNSVLPPNPGAMMTIIDDDGALGFYTQLLPIIKSKHIPIASAIVGSKIGVAPAYMTWEQVEECFAEGAEILNHTYMHYGETDETRPTNEIRMDYTRNANLMQAHNIPTGDIVVYPGGSGNMVTAQAAAKRFASAAFRSNGNKLNLINQIDPFYIDRYRIETEYSYDLDQMKGLIDNCLAKGGWMVWMIHTSSGYNWNENALSAVSQAIDYAISSGLPIVTARYGIERYIKKRPY